MRAAGWIGIVATAATTATAAACGQTAGQPAPAASATAAATATATAAATASATAAGSATAAATASPGATPCPPDEVFVPATGPDGFTMGKDMSVYGFGPRAKTELRGGTKARADAPHKVVLTKAFCMDANEVTAGQLKACVEEKGCKPPSILDRWQTYREKPDYPANMTDYHVAKLYCEKQGRSLPTEAQWEWAATGGDGRKWPWGDEEPDCTRADFTKDLLVSPGGDSGCHGGGPSPVGAHPAGDRVWPSGHIHDLAGNVWEWVIDEYVPYPSTPQTDPVVYHNDFGLHVVRGGGWNRSGRGIMAAFRGAAIDTYKVPGLGFRCVTNL